MYGVGGTGRCPHCGVVAQLVTSQLLGNALTVRDFDQAWLRPAGFEPKQAHHGDEADFAVGLISRTCTNCGRLVVTAIVGSTVYRVWPRTSRHVPVPDDVPEAIRQDYEEACLVLADSPKASAALSRRCLQHLLAEKAGVKGRNLADQIDSVLSSLPKQLADQLDAVRNVGNFAAHPAKSTSTGEIVNVEPHEAEWNLDVLEMLFDFYYVQPKQIAAKRAALDAKLSDAGKPPLK